VRAWIFLVSSGVVGSLNGDGGVRTIVLSGVRALSPGAGAQVGEHGRITTRSNIELAIEGAPGTSG
jgi:hypothetical protein